jgi:hypothetical protein
MLKWKLWRPSAVLAMLIKCSAVIRKNFVRHKVCEFRGILAFMKRRHGAGSGARRCLLNRAAQPGLGWILCDRCVQAGPIHGVI